jgi:electron-transferring-flavoprotein dehydrogenase
MSRAVRNGWIGEELRKVRNAEPAVAKFGATIGTLLAGTDMWMQHLGIGLPSR